jgi:hypothetical protein
MLNKIQNDEVSDTTDDPISTAAGNIKKFLLISPAIAFANILFYFSC